MKKPVVAMIIALLLSTVACSIKGSSFDAIEPQIVFINEELPQAKQEAELNFKMGAGRFIISPGADGLVNGTIKYNAKQFEPKFTRSDGLFEIKPSKSFEIKSFPFNDLENTWELNLTDAIPLRLNIEGGASENVFDFSGLQLTQLNINQGASDTKVYFNSPNPVSLDNFSLSTGASSTKIYGLGNAHIRNMNISFGAGDYTLDFSGALTQDMNIDIKAGISNITIIIPSDMKSVIQNTGTVTNINSKGTWMLTDKTYSTPNDGFTLTITLNMAVGNVNLIHQD